jgi:HK97 family phage prohead protease
MSKKQFTSFNIEIKAADDDKRQITAIGTKEINDRDNDLVSVDGMDLKNFKKNPTFMWSHRSSETPENILGTAKKVWKEGKNLMFTLDFLEEDINPRADMVYKMYKAGALRAFSIGFAPDWNTASYNEKRGGFDFPKSELLEISAVAVPANQAALVQNMIEMGIADEAEAKDFEIFMKELQPEIEDDRLERKVKILEAKFNALQKRFDTPPVVEPVVEPLPVDFHIVDQALEELFAASDLTSTDATEDKVEDDDPNSIFTELE